MYGFSSIGEDNYMNTYGSHGCGIVGFTRHRFEILTVNFIFNCESVVENIVIRSLRNMKYVTPRSNGRWKNDEPPAPAKKLTQILTEI